MKPYSLKKKKKRTETYLPNSGGEVSCLEELQVTGQLTKQRISERLGECSCAHRCLAKVFAELCVNRVHFRTKDST